MSMTYYTVDDLRPGRSGWGVKRFSALNDAISHYRSLPMDGARVLGMADDTHAYEPVSYTHLDVYKRQPVEHPDGAGTL